MSDDRKGKILSPFVRDVTLQATARKIEFKCKVEKYTSSSSLTSSEKCFGYGIYDRH